MKRVRTLDTRAQILKEKKKTLPHLPKPWCTELAGASGTSGIVEVHIRWPQYYLFTKNYLTLEKEYKLTSFIHQPIWPVKNSSADQINTCAYLGLTSFFHQKLYPVKNSSTNQINTYTYHGSNNFRIIPNRPQKELISIL